VTINQEPLAFYIRRCACKKHKLDAKRLSIGGPLLFICDAAHVKSISYMLMDHQSGTPYFCMQRCACKKYKLDAKGLSIKSPLLFVCGTVHVKSIS
jgi:hypothetical protein